MTPVEVSEQRRSFCAGLKSERERRGTPISAIAASTKVKASLLEALERGDLSRWPTGIYRRAFFREYVAAIGLPPEPMASNFLELFTDGERPCVSPSLNGGSAEPVHLRLLLGDDPPAAVVAQKDEDDVRARLLAAAADVCAICALAWIAAAVSPMRGTYVALTLGVLVYMAATWLGTSPSLWLLDRVRRLRTPATAASHVRTFSPSTLPYNVHAPSAAPPSLAGRLAEALGGFSLRDFSERRADSPRPAGQRRRDLASVRRQRAEAANRTTADEVSVT
jgi:hypothetical protein